MDKRVLRKLLKVYYSDFRRSLFLGVGIAVFVMVIFLVSGLIQFDLSFLPLPIVLLLFGVILYGPKLSVYFKGIRDIRKGNYESKYIICNDVNPEKKGIFSKRSDSALTHYILQDDKKEIYRIATVQPHINVQVFKEFMNLRKWRVIYLKKARIILNIQLNNSGAKTSKDQKYEDKIAIKAKELFGTFGKKA